MTPALPDVETIALWKPAAAIGGSLPPRPSYLSRCRWRLFPMQRFVVRGLLAGSVK